MKLKMKYLFLSLVLLAIFPDSFSQSVYGLKECIGIGLERNFSLLVARNNETIASNNFTPGNAGYLPSLSLNSSYSGTLTDSKQKMTDGSTNSASGVYNTTSANSVSLGWTLFDGFSVRTTYKKLGELKKQGELNTRLAAENLVSEIISGYYNYIQQIQLLNNMKYAVALSKERLRIDEDRYLLGSGSKLEVLQSRVYLNADSSRLSKQSEVVRSAQVKLNELMAADDVGASFLTQDTAIQVNPTLLYDDLLDQTLSRNTGLLIAAGNRTLSEYDYRIISSRTYPYLNLTSGYSYNMYNYSSSTTKTNAVKGMNYGLTLGFNLFDGFTQRRSIRNATIDMQNKELLYQQLEQGIRADLITIFNAYSNNLRLITLEKQNLSTAAENLDIALERYKLGSLSGIDLREVQKSLLDARESLLSIQYQAKIAEVSLMLISGRIM
ncbi:MAG TPA: TolC family protein, partial [Bacteroidales bacterium]|nr:TolC family protein [Bacteroidales bacterium]